MKKMFLLIALCTYLFCVPSDHLINNFTEIVKKNIIRSNDSGDTICKKKYNILECLTGGVSDSIYEIQDILAQYGMALVYGDFFRGMDIKRVQ